jgi:hypothetical protein
MAFNYAVLFFVPSALCLFLLRDQKDKTTEVLQKRSDVQRQKKLEGDIVKLIQKRATTSEEDKKLADLLKKGSSD